MHLRAAILDGDLAAQFVVDENANDGVEIGIALEAQRLGARGGEFAGPAFHDPQHIGVGFAADQLERLARPRRGAAPRVARRPSPTDPASTACAASRAALNPFRRLSPPHQSPRAGSRAMRAHAHRPAEWLPAPQRLANDAGEKSRRRLVRQARTHADGRQANADAIEEAAARIIRQQQFADGLLRAVARYRRQEEFIRHESGSGAPKAAIDEVKTTRGL